MTRPRLATSILDARGSFKDHPERKRKRDGEPENMPELSKSPRGFTPQERAIWREFTKCMHKGAVFEPDRYIVELAVRLITKMRNNWDEMTAAEMGRLQGALGQLGMSPAERSKLNVLKKPESAKDPWSDL